MPICPNCGRDVNKVYLKGKDKYGYPIRKCVLCIREEARKGVLY